MKEKDFYNLTWNYFQQHSNQRIHLINYFIALEVFLYTAMYNVAMSTNDAGGYQRVFCVAIPIASLIITFVFWNMDRRTRELIKNSEQVLRTFEAKYKDQLGEDSMIFTLEEGKTKSRQKRCILPMSYSACLIWLYGLFTIFSIVSIILIFT